MNVKVSIVIPVYNVEPYLRECLESVINQTLVEIEVICVNDASTDNSLRILNEFAASDKRIVIVNQIVNGGLSASRNIGASYAKGKYLYFLDSDDLLKTDAMEKCYKFTEKNEVDIVVFDMLPFENENIKGNADGLLDAYTRSKCYSGIWSGKDFFAKLMTDRNYIANVGVYLFNRAYYIKNKFQFIEGIFYEDLPCMLDALLGAEKVIHISEKFYRKRIRMNSIITADKNFDHVYGLWKNYLVLYDLIKKYKITGAVKKYVVNIMCGRLIKCRDFYGLLDENEAEKYVSLNHAERELFKYLIISCVRVQKENEKFQNKIFSLKQENDLLKKKNNDMEEVCTILKKDIENIERNLNNIKTGLSFKIGRIITYLPRRIRGFLNEKTEV